MEINKEITIEDLIEKLPASVRFLSEKGIKCIACGEPVWGTLEEAAKEKGFSDAAIDVLVTELNQMAKKSPSGFGEAHLS
jgi:methionine synthase II (cobalamin-independent)